MKIVTLNTWGIHEPYQKRTSLIAAELSRLNPDLVCLQEVFSADQENKIKQNLPIPYSHHAHTAGLVILSKQPFLKTAELKYKTFSQMDSNDRRAIFTKVCFGGKTLWIGNTHLAWKGADENVRTGQTRELADQLQKLGDLSIAIGDFNAGPNSPSVEQIKFAGFIDIFDSLHPGKKIYSWDNDRNHYLKTHSAMFPNRRIDLILASKKLFQNIKLKSCELAFTAKDAEGNLPSDHFGVMAEFE